ncbi:MAG: hypothetical protein IJ087_12580 [Eggerthellaceae bacterium]|nr:hypothetical protein [Eggerthellaceae bacterium]
MESIEKLHKLAADMNSTEIISHMDVIGKFVFHPYMGGSEARRARDDV